MKIPLMPEAPDSVQFAIRQRFKLFYRPPLLNGNLAEAAQVASEQKRKKQIHHAPGRVSRLYKSSSCRLEKRQTCSTVDEHTGYLCCPCQDLKRSA